MQSVALYQTQSRFSLDHLLRLCLVAIVVVGVVGIFLNNALVSVRAEKRKLTSTIEALQLQNAELKNALFAATDSENLTAAASRLGLVRENSPRYLDLSDAESVAIKN